MQAKYWIPLFSIAFLLFQACNNSMSKSSDKNDAQVEENLEEVKDTLVPEDSYEDISRDRLLGRFNPAKDTLFEKLTASHASGSGLGAYLHKESLEAFKKMHAAAKADGVKLSIISATRNFYRQKQIWEAKWEGRRKVGGQNLAKAFPDPAKRAKKILLYSSMPGTSRHHWGTDMDLNALENSYFASGKGLKEYEWLLAHAAEYGFGQPYTRKGESRKFGYEEEKWHWSYLPLAKRYLAAYQLKIKASDIVGFQGSSVASTLNVIEEYVMGIAPACK